MHQTVPVIRRRVGQWVEGADCVAAEVPIALEFNGVSHAVMMATPADVEDFAYGFAMTEGIVETPSQIYECESSVDANGGTVSLRIAESCFVRLKEKRRNLTGRTGCGLCGTESLSHAVRQPAPLPPWESSATGQKFAMSAISRAMQNLRELQTLQALTGATHAAAWCSADGTIHLIREDIGRHNALDKLIGALYRTPHERDARSGFILITSRASYEMVQKTASAGITLLAAVSAATGLAIEVANQAGLTLLGFTRGGDATLYSHPERLDN